MAPRVKSGARPTMTEPELVAALRARYGPPEHAFLEQQRSRTGYGGAITTADGLAMSLFPSRGFELIAFEIKAGKHGRKDWLREKKRPWKADEIYQHVDRWWLVAGDDQIVREGELPPTWGLAVPAPRGGLKIAVPAPKLKPRAASRPFLAAIFRNLEKAKRGMILRSEIETTLQEAQEAAREEGRQEGAGGDALRRVTGDLEELRRRVATFEKASGVEIDPWRAEEIGHAVRVVLTIGTDEALREADALARSLGRASERLAEKTKRARAQLARVDPEQTP